MLHTKDNTTTNTRELLDRAVDVARSFGFTSLGERLASLDKKRLAAANKIIYAHKREQAFMPPMRSLASCEVYKQKEHVLGYDITPRTGSTPSTFALHIAGTESPIAEATLLAAAHTLLADIGITDTMVHINSLGSGDSFTRYMRDLSKYLKKVTSDLPLQVRTDLAVSPMRAYARLTMLNRELAESGPRSIDYLNDEGRSHLWGVLEYLEGAGIPYVIDTSVVGSGDCFEHTLFELHGAGGQVLAHGGRYSMLGRKAYKRHIPSTGIIFELPDDTEQPMIPSTTPDVTAPRFFFAQLGTGAKKLGLKVLAKLHKAGIKVDHRITEESLSNQMTTPGSREAPYTIIIGHKEALEDSVIVRDTSNMRQTTVPVNHLVSHLKRLGV